jgi:hypothetical protein
MTIDPLLHPSLSLLVKLGSAVCHAVEARGDKGHPYDWTAFEQCANDKEVRDWLRAMTEAGFMVVKR